MEILCFLLCHGVNHFMDAFCRGNNHRKYDHAYSECVFTTVFSEYLFCIMIPPLPIT